MAKSVAAQRQSRAVKTLIEAILLALLPLAIPFAVPWGLSAFKLASQPPWLTLTLNSLSWLCWAWALLLLWQAWRMWQSASKADRATGAFIPVELRPLQNQNWTLDSSAVGGDGQIVAKAPSGQTYCIVFKSDRGKVGTDGRQVFRLYDSSPQPFPANFIDQVKQRSARVQQRVRARQVVPVLAFTEAIVALDRNPISGVWVVQVSDLRRLLLQQEAQTQR